MLPRRLRECVNDLPELTFDYPQQAYDHSLFPADEKAAIAQLRQFCKTGAAAYEACRDFAIEGTSRLSACLALGVLSPRQCLHRLLAEQPGAGGALVRYGLTSLSGANSTVI